MNKKNLIISRARQTGPSAEELLFRFMYDELYPIRQRYGDIKTKEMYIKALPKIFILQPLNTYLYPYWMLLFPNITDNLREAELNLALNKMATRILNLFKANDNFLDSALKIQEKILTRLALPAEALGLATEPVPPKFEWRTMFDNGRRIDYVPMPLFDNLPQPLSTFERVILDFSKPSKRLFKNNNKFMINSTDKFRLPRKLKKKIKKAREFLMNQRQSKFKENAYNPMIPSQCFPIKTN